jgi:2-polyprenyl-6-hydroxyphenyl methylase/3-demethylubiquinone-9 3-methyltransferase
MSLYYDAVDWVGGWPFETAAATEIEAFLILRGFTLVQKRTVGHRHGCNEFVFTRVGPALAPAAR